MNQADYNLWTVVLGSISAAISLGVGIVIYCYTLETQKLRKATEAQVAQLQRAAEEQMRRRPILTAEPTLRMSPEFVNHNPHGLGCYATFTVINTGLSTALRCQPVVTMMYEKHTQPSGAVGWRPAASWIPLPLLWSLDEPNIAGGKPTQERDLVPRRPYLFDLGNCTTTSPDTFYLRATSHPFSQPTNFTPGEFSFEITVFSDNAEPIAKWVRLKWHGNFVLPSPRRDLEYLRNPPHEMMQRIELDGLPRDPSAPARDSV